MPIVHELTYDGKTLPLGDWAEAFNLPYETLHKRVIALGWDAGRALTTPVGQVSKDVAERELNDTAIADLPKVIKDLVLKDKYQGARPGRYVRDKYRSAFDAWFENEFKPAYKK